MTTLLATGTGLRPGALASWVPLYALVLGYAAVVVLLAVFGESQTPSGPWPLAVVRRVSNSLTRLTGIPGWAAAQVGTGLFGLLLAGIGFYSDVAWHVALGRDKQLFTAPHTMIVLGLGAILLAAILGVLVASVDGAPTALRWRSVRVPWSSVPLAILGATAVAGFPLDDLWHAQYGIDVTMWSPTHMLMILGASFSPLAAWLTLAEAGVRPTDSRWARGLYLVGGWLLLAGLSSAQGEFNFGVPQFQQLYLPVLIAVAGGFALVAARIVLGGGGALGAVVLMLVVQGGGLARSSGAVQTRPGALYVAGAIVIELVALTLGTARLTRFAVVGGLAAGTVGILGEWPWNMHAYQPWHAALLRDALVAGGLGGLAAGILGAAFAAAVLPARGRRIPALLVAGAGLLCLAVLVAPFPRRVGHVEAAVHLEMREASAIVHVTLTPADAADHNRWFQVVGWQGGDLELAEMHKVGPGEWVANRPVLILGPGKTLLRLHRGAEMMALPIHFPADPAIHKPAIDPVDRTEAFTSEKPFLLREVHGGSALFADAIFLLLGLVAISWVGSYVLAASRIARANATVVRGPELTGDLAEGGRAVRERRDSVSTGR